MRGRKPKPTKLKIMTGNPGKRPLNKREPKPRAGAPVCPTQLDAKAKALWKRIADQLAAMGLISQADGVALELLCDAYSQWREARKEGQSGAEPWKRVKSMLAEFGLTPSSRSRLAVDPLD